MLNMEPELKLALSLQSNPGVYALLLGSGISRSANIPTGWEITLDLINKLAIARGETPLPDPQIWFTKNYGIEPDYSKILEELAPAPSERMALLRGYFELANEELEQGIKIPSPAHRAIARLVKMQIIKVIITTNFDRLMEQALEEEGITPDVIRSEDDLHGVVPFAHSKCYVVKLHGDYRDTRIRNTSEELTNYSVNINNLLDQLMDEFGLIVCGWSAVWDTALRNAITRCPTRRYTTYWLAHQGQLTKEAQDLIKQRRAEQINIDSADTFFVSLEEKVEALLEMNRPHPLSTAAAIATVKRYLPDPLQRIRLYDLIREEQEQVKDILSSPRFDSGSPEPSDESVPQRLNDYNIVMEQLLAITSVIAFYSEKNYSGLLQTTVERLCDPVGDKNPYYDLWLKLHYYPALLFMYTTGIVALAQQNYYHLAALLVKGRYYDQNKEKPAIAKLNAEKLIGSNKNQDYVTGRYKGEYTPFSNYLFELLRPILKDYLPDDWKYEDTFDLFEYILSLTYMDQLNRNDWAPVGRYGWRYNSYADRPWQESPIAKFVLQNKELGAKSPFLQAGFFGGSTERFEQIVQDNWSVVQKRCASWD